MKEEEKVKVSNKQILQTLSKMLMDQLENYPDQLEMDNDGGNKTITDEEIIAS